ncbi:MAG: selenide, water dikinase SelD, partial [Desulfobacterales bacterium]
ILTNRGCRPGDALILTKPLGTGVLFNAGRSGKLPYPDLEAILPLVAALNAKAIETALKYEIHACTDITGFGILGHALEMAKGSDVQIELDYKRLPFYPHALKMYQQGETTGSNQANQKLAEGSWEMVHVRTSEEEELLFDPQTSGGLLLSLAATQADDLLAALKKAGVDTATRVGQVIAGDRPFVKVI